MKRSLPLLSILLLLPLLLASCMNPASTTPPATTDGVTEAPTPETYDRTAYTAQVPEIPLDELPKELPDSEAAEIEAFRKSVELPYPVGRIPSKDGTEDGLYMMWTRNADQKLICRVGDYIGPVITANGDVGLTPIRFDQALSNDNLRLVTNKMSLGAGESVNDRVSLVYRALKPGLTIVAAYAVCEEAEVCEVIFIPIYIVE